MRIWRHTRFLSEHAPPIIAAVLDSGVAGELEKLMAETQQGQQGTDQFCIDEIFEAPGVPTPQNANAAAQRRAKQRSKRESAMAMLYYWNANALAQTQTQGVVNPKPAPLDRDDIVAVFEQLKHHSAVRGHSVCSHTRLGETVTLHSDGHVDYEASKEYLDQRKTYTVNINDSKVIMTSVDFVMARTTIHDDVPVFPMIRLLLRGEFGHYPTGIVALLPKRLRIIHPQDKIKIIDADSENVFLELKQEGIHASDEYFQRWVARKRLFRFWFLRLCGQTDAGRKWHTDFVVNETNTLCPAQVAPEIMLRVLGWSESQWQAASTKSQHCWAGYQTIFRQLPVSLRCLDRLPGTRLVLNETKFLAGTRHYNSLYVTEENYEACIDFMEVGKLTNHDVVVASFKEAQQLAHQYQVTADATAQRLLQGIHDALHDDAAVKGYLPLLLNAEDIRWLGTISKDAHVFELASGDDIRLVNNAETYLRAMLRLTRNKQPLASIDGVRDALHSMAGQVPLPAPLPFKSIYIGLGAGYTPVGDHLRQPPHKPFRVGWLLSEDGYIFNFDWVVHPETLLTGMCITTLRRPTGWTQSHTKAAGFDLIAPWVFTLLIGALNDYRTVRLQQPRPITDAHLLKGRKSKEQPQNQRLPPPYYQVIIEDIIIDETRRKLPRLSVPVNWSHRWPVRGHKCNKIQRGTLPLDAEIGAKLRRRGYTIYQDPSQVTSDLAAFLMKRKLAQLAPGQWLAHKEKWKAPDIRPHNREDLPYVPSAYVLKDKIPPPKDD